MKRKPQPSLKPVQTVEAPTVEQVKIGNAKCVWALRAFKRIAATLLICSALTVLAGARLLWDDPNPDGIVGKFVVYHATNIAGPFLVLGESATTNGLELPPLRSGNHFFYVTAVGTNGLESDPSNQVLAPVVNPPQGTKIVIVIQ